MNNVHYTDYIIFLCHLILCVEHEQLLYIFLFCFCSVEYSKMNPNHQIPTVSDGTDFHLFECTTILQYIVNKYQLTKCTCQCQYDRLFSWLHTLSGLFAVIVNFNARGEYFVQNEYALHFHYPSRCNNCLLGPWIESVWLVGLLLSRLPDNFQAACHRRLALGLPEHLVSRIGNKRFVLLKYYKFNNIFAQTCCALATSIHWK